MVFLSYACNQNINFQRTIDCSNNKNDKTNRQDNNHKKKTLRNQANKKQEFLLTIMMEFDRIQFYAMHVMQKIMKKNNEFNLFEFKQIRESVTNTIVEMKEKNKNSKYKINRMSTRKLTN